MDRHQVDDTGVHVHDIGGESDDWRDLAPGIQIRVLRTTQATGVWAVLYKVAAGTTAAPHQHFGSSDSYVIKGKMIGTAGRTLQAGDYVYEPNSDRVHKATYFEEDTLYLYIHQGPFMHLDEAGKMIGVTDWNAMRKLQK
jgi:anti-sigma factor ChrR (cupin superfamily)